MPTPWSRIKAVVGEALELDPVARGSFVAAQLNDDPDALARARALLEAAANASIIDPPTADPASLELDHDRTFQDCSGLRIGQYQITRLIGRGGMGAVYEAIQDAPRRSVALKLMNTGLASRQAVRRFKDEASVLGKLRHPSIAQVYEAGVYQPPAPGAASVPYFAMEYVPDALPITLAAAARKLSLRDRVHLCIQTCDAVQHGHQRGVIHRDLKPANILADPTGESALIPKIIDFGVARVTLASDDSLIATAFTTPGQIVGTLRYMSPEQASGDDTDTRSDVYSLGVILYEIFTGRHPLEMKSSSIAQTLATIQTAVPVRPSTIVKELRGDLETILLKAVEKDRSRRYQSAADLASDLTRFLNDEPIMARPPSTAYALRTFARRNRTLVGGFLATVLALSAGIVGTTVGLVRARHAETLAEDEAARSLRVADFLKDTLRSVDPNLAVPVDPKLQKIDPWRNAWRGEQGWGFAGTPGHKATIVEMLKSAAAQLDRRFAADPLVRADLSLLLGQSLAHQSEFETATALLQEAVDIRRQQLGEDSTQTQYARLEYAEMLRVANRTTEAIHEYQNVLDRTTATRGWLDPMAIRAAASLTRIEAIADPKLAARDVRMHYDRIV